MKTKLTRTLFAILLLLSTIISFGQRPTFDVYDIVILKKEDVKNVLQNLPGFAYFDFTYVKLNDGSYALEGYAKDKDNNPLGSLISLAPMANTNHYRFKDSAMGYLRLDLATMNENNVDGSENYVLTPRRCLDSLGHYRDFVSYRFSNRPEPSVGFFGDKEITSVTAVKAFTLNPSPPY